MQNTLQLRELLHGRSFGIPMYPELILVPKTSEKPVLVLKGENSKAVPVYAMKAYTGSSGIAPLILNVGTIWR